MTQTQSADTKLGKEQYTEVIGSLRSHLEAQCALAFALHEHLDGRQNPFWQTEMSNVPLVQRRTY